MKAILYRLDCTAMTNMSTFPCLPTPLAHQVCPWTIVVFALLIRAQKNCAENSPWWRDEAESL